MSGHKKTLLACILAMHSQFFCAQTSTPTYTWQDFVEEISDDEYAEEQGWTEQMEELALLAAHPMDINTATREQLRQLPFLSDTQIEEIHEYVFLHQGMRSISELLAISSLDYRMRRFLSLFLYADQAVFVRRDTLTLKSLLNNSRHEVAVRMDIPLYYRDGYSYSPQQGGYNGSTLYNNVRYRLKSRQHLDFGLLAEKDQGEPFRNNGGWDHYGLHLMVRDMGILRVAVAGDYRMGFGEGLVVNTGFTTGKSSLMGRPSQGIRAHQGLDEVNFFRGGAATFRVKETELTAWVSHRKLDATLNSDGTVRTLLTSGLHRTDSELDKKGNLGSTLAGGNVTWQHKGAHLGATGYFQHFHRDLSPGTALYRRIYPEGRDFGAVGTNYGYTHLWFSVSGETAYSTNQGGWATLERASWQISPRYTLSGSYRFYSYKYYSFYASAIAENSRVQNESGATLRLDATPIDQLTTTLYADFFYNPWPRYSMTHSSSGQELTATVQYQWQRHHTLSIRYQLKHKEQNDLMHSHHRLRLLYTCQQGRWWQFQSSLHTHTLAASGTGWALGQRMRYRRGSVQADALMSYFHTPDYDTRIFQPEPLLTNTFRLPSLYGHGLRLAATARYTLWRGRLLAEVLYGLTRYFDRRTQSSGMQKIRSPWRQDVSLQLRLRL